MVKDKSAKLLVKKIQVIPGQLSVFQLLRQRENPGTDAHGEPCLSGLRGFHQICCRHRGGPEDAAASASPSRLFQGPHGETSPKRVSYNYV